MTLEVTTGTGEYTFRTVEHCYQYMRAYPFGYEKEAGAIFDASTPLRAKKIGRVIREHLAYPLLQHLMHLADVLMEALVRFKFQDHGLRQELLATGNAELVEASRGPQWGAGKNLGELKRTKSTRADPYGVSSSITISARSFRLVVLTNGKLLCRSGSPTERLLRDWNVLVIPSAETVRLLWIARLLDYYNHWRSEGG